MRPKARTCQALRTLAGLPIRGRAVGLHQRHAGRPKTSRGTRRLAACVVLGSLLVGCNSTATHSDIDASDPFAQLRLLADQSSTATRRLNPPDPRLAPIGTDDPGFARAHQPLSELTEDAFVSPTDLATTENIEPATPSNEDRTEAVRLYARGRQQLAAGDADGAITSLERASAADPEAAEIWRALGDARRAARYGRSAGQAYQRAAELGLAEPEALTLAGLESLEQGEPEAAARTLLRAIRVRPAHADALIDFVAHAALGNALSSLGYDRASADAFAVAVEIPRAARVPTNLGREAAAVQRQRADMLVAMGDASLRLGEYQKAADAYERARLLPGANGVQDRLVYALRTTGNDAGAAIVLLDEIAVGRRVAPATVNALAELASTISPRSAIADAIARIDDQNSATRRGRLIAAQADALPRAEALRLLRTQLRTDTRLSTPSRRGLIAAGLRRFDPATPNDSTDRAESFSNSDAFSERLAWLQSLIADNNAIAADAAHALQNAAGTPADLFARLSEGLTPASRGRSEANTPRNLLAAEYALLSGDRDAILAHLAKFAADPCSATPDRLARLAAAVGRFDLVDAAIDCATPAADATGSSPASRHALAETLRAAQRFDAARAVLSESAAESASEQPATPHASTRPVDDLLERSALESIAGRIDTARELLVSARNADPLDERTLAALFAFHAPDGPDPDPEAINNIGRVLRSDLPDSDLLRTILAGEMLRGGLINDAADIVNELLDSDPTDANALDAMLNLWRRRAETESADANELDRVRAAADRHPNAPGPVRLLAAGLVLAGDTEPAVALLEEFEARTSNRSLAALREQIIRDGLKDPARADRLARDRLSPVPRSIDDAVALASILARDLDQNTVAAGDLQGIIDPLEAIPLSSQLSAAQMLSAQNAVVRAAVAIDGQRRRRNAGAAAEHAVLNASMIELLDWADRRNLALSPGIHDLRLALIDEAGLPAQSLIAAAENAIALAPSTTRAFSRRTADLLVARGDADAAFEWLRDQSIQRGEGGAPQLADDRFQEWFRLVIVTEATSPPAGSATASLRRSREMIETLRTAELIDTAWRLVRPTAFAGDGRDSANAAEMAYLFALYTPGADGTENTRLQYLRLALEYDPSHPWAANDLGYTILESGGDLAEAERLIEIAYRGKPDQANIVDSLGWVRYHRGKLEDVTDPDTGEITRGAVSLLRDAVERSEPDDDGVVHDHLGDALYAAGKTDEAVRAWRDAARMANEALSRLRASPQPGGVRFEELSDLALRAVMKPNAIQLGQAPNIEPQRGVDRPAGTN